MDVRDLFDSNGHFRGEIHNPERRRQLISFHGLRYGRSTPTDFDLVVELRNQWFVITEIKYDHSGEGTLAPCESGQERCMTNIVDRIASTGARAVLFLASHTVHDPRLPVLAATCPVLWHYKAGEWVKHTTPEPLRENMDRFLGLRSE